MQVSSDDEIGEENFDKAAAYGERTIVLRQSGSQIWRLVLPSITLIAVLFRGLLRTHFIGYAVPVLAGTSALLGVWFVRMAPRLFQTLTLDDEGMLWRLGRDKRRYLWRDVTGLRLMGEMGTSTGGGTAIELANEPPMVLNTTWEIGQSELVALLQQRFEAATGRTIPVIGERVLQGSRGLIWPILGAAAMCLVVFGLSEIWIVTGRVGLPDWLSFRVPDEWVPWAFFVPMFGALGALPFSFWVMRDRDDGRLDTSDSTRKTALSIVVGFALATVATPFAAYIQAQPLRDQQGCSGLLGPNAIVGGCTAMLARDDLTPENRSNVLSRRGAAHDNEGEYDQALTDFNEALAIKPDNLSARVGRCLTYGGEDENYRGFLDCAEAARLDSKYVPLALLLHGGASQDTGQYDQALQDYNSVFVLQPDNAMAFLARCDVLNMIGDTDQALADCNRALAMLPSDRKQVLATRGFVLLKMGRYKDAAQDFGDSLRNDPRWAPALFGRGLIERHNGNDAASAADLALAEKIKPKISAEVAHYGLRI